MKSFLNFITMYLFMLITIHSTFARKFQTRVYNGKPAKLKDFPYQVNLFLKRRASSSTGIDCSGSLISNSHVLTAAHCFYPHGPMGEFLMAGDMIFGSIRKYAPFNEDTVVRKISAGDIFIHNGYTSLQHNDIAIIILAAPVSFKVGVIEPVRLPALNQSNFLGTTLTVAGWGNTFDRSKSIPEFLMYTQVTITDDTYCSRFRDFVPNVKICGKSLYSSSCHGDSGAGVTIKEFDDIKTVVGIVSGGIDFCEDKGPQLFAGVHYHLQWIYKITGLTVRHT